MAYAEAMIAYNEALSRAPDYINAHNNMALSLLQQKRFVQSRGALEKHVCTFWKAQRTHAEHVLSLAPQLEQAEQLLVSIREQLNSLDSGSSQDQ